MKTKELCIYHGNCSDGFGSAYIFWQFFKQYEKNIELLFYAADYKNPPPWDLIDQVENVYIVDFSYSLEVCKEILDYGVDITIIDHHKTAFEEFQDLSDIERLNDTTVKRYVVDDGRMLTIRIDQTKSGVGNVWEYFYLDRIEMPKPLQYIQDRDLWKWEFPESKAFLKGWDLLPWDFERWDREIYKESVISEKLIDGATILAYEEKQLNSMMEKVSIRYLEKYGKYGFVECPSWLCSDLGNKMMLELDIDFAVMAQYDTIDETWNFSLRSLSHKVDVSAIAKDFGGGGHHNASGCSINGNYEYLNFFNGEHYGAI